MVSLDAGTGRWFRRHFAIHCGNLNSIMITAAIFSLVFMQSAAQPPPSAKVEGQIVNAMTGEPLKKATVRLNGSFVASQNGGPPATYAATSGEGGKFVIEGIPSGTYILWASRTGFVASAYGAKAPGMNGGLLNMGPGQELKDVVVKLIPQAMIFGRVVDEDGEPFPNASVRLWRWTYS